MLNFDAEIADHHLLLVERKSKRNPADCRREKQVREAGGDTKAGKVKPRWHLWGEKELDMFNDIVRTRAPVEDEAARVAFDEIRSEMRRCR